MESGEWTVHTTTTTATSLYKSGWYVHTTTLLYSVDSTARSRVIDGAHSAVYAREDHGEKSPRGACDHDNTASYRR
jgi:hypothetical protein